jgi:hypothetical protein
MKQVKENKTTQPANINPKNFVYPKDTKVEIEGFLLTDLIMIFDKLVNEEIKAESRFKYNYVNEKGKVIKNVKQEDLESGKVRKVLDIDRTIVNPTMDYSISEKGLAYAELKNFLESLHHENIQKGLAVDYQELTRNLHEQAQKED